MVNQFAMPSSLAANQDEFQALFYNIPHNDWLKCKGFGFAHLLAYELDELILSTPGMSSPDIDDAKIEFAQVLAHYLKDECLTLPKVGTVGFVYYLKVPSVIEGEPPMIVKKYWDGSQYKDLEDTLIDIAYDMMHRIYVPTAEEYEYLASKEYGADNGTPIVEGVYDSVSDEESGWFNFCLNRWNGWHDAHQDIDEADRQTAKLMRDFRKSIEDEWKTLTADEQLSWRRG